MVGNVPVMAGNVSDFTDAKLQFLKEVHVSGGNIVNLIK